MTSNNLTCQQYSRYFFSISIHAVFSAASHKCYKVITMIVIKENYCLCKINKYYKEYYNNYYKKINTNKNIKKI